MFCNYAKMILSVSNMMEMSGQRRLPYRRSNSPIAAIDRGSLYSSVQMSFNDGSMITGEATVLLEIKMYSVFRDNGKAIEQDAHCKERR